VLKAINKLPEDARQRVKKKPQPSWTNPMLTTLTHDVFSRQGWIFERKLDGERCLAFGEGHAVRLMSRNKKALNDTYPEIEQALQDQQVTHFILDGEVVAFAGNVTSFERLQDRMQVKDRQQALESTMAVYYYIFDVIYFDGYDVSRLALRHRKALLRKGLSFNDPLRLTPYRNQQGEEVFAEACTKHWEGIIAKDATSRYMHHRSRDWLKFKCQNQQEFVIGGYTDPQGERIGFGALVIGYYEAGALRYAGKVGTGYDEDELKRLSARLAALGRKTPPFDATPLSEAGVHWVTPKLVAQVAFTEWTEDHRLRHPRFKGLRRDKSPTQVHRERSVSA
jgi:bifunctional non-homologous end joining protein LigD